MFLEPDPFLNELNKLYERNKSSTGPARTVWITCKRCEWRPAHHSIEQCRQAVRSSHQAAWSSNLWLLWQWRPSSCRLSLCSGA